MTGLVRGLLAAPVAWLVGWLASAGVHVSSDLVTAAVTAVVGALAMAGLHLAEHRWPALARAVAWLSRERGVLLVDHGAPPTGILPPITGRGQEFTAGPSNVRRVPPEG